METPLAPRLHSSKKVAVVGGGCAGIAALWALNRSPHDAYLYEASDRLGGHVNTVEFRKGKFKTLVDTGFIVMNAKTYPNFNRFLKKLGIETAPTEMSFSVSRDGGRFEWAGASLNALFCQRTNLLSPRFWRMIFDIVRFSQFALDILRTDEAAEETLGEYLEREGYSDAFRDNYLVPMAAAVWSTPPDKLLLDFPIATLIRFMWNHHLLSVVGSRPQWLTITDGSRSYINKVMHGFPSNHLRLRATVTSLTNDPDGRVRLHTSDGRSEVFDHVILATHGDQAYSIIRASATAEEHSILQHFRTTPNVAVLHSDRTLLPRSPNAVSSWNYLSHTPTPFSTRASQACVTYNMNLLQHIPRDVFGDVLVTLNPPRDPAPGTVQGRFEFRHAAYTPNAVRAQRCLGKIQNKRGISYAGAWTGYGFHEDAFSSGVKVAVEHLGATVPFEDWRDASPRRSGRIELVLLLLPEHWCGQIPTVVLHQHAPEPGRRLNLDLDLGIDFSATMDL
ncbi:hypothetical protein VTJ49DRAFT_3476 [Mycothermus thermophilus]|uniref:Amine oxidase domain-containing protein n=1 Tax=Humicola insolens TaxID=85995 RepID=A0ABR3VM84_HUMIN